MQGIREFEGSPKLSISIGNESSKKPSNSLAKA